jgi:hypothetical protein
LVVDSPTNQTRQDIERGFHVEQPSLYVPWGIPEAQLRQMLGTQAKLVTAGYVACACTSLGGLSHQLGFHFLPRPNGLLAELEFFRRDYPDQRASFDEFQAHLEATFGSPTRSLAGMMGFPTLEWEFGSVVVKHFMAYRYMPEEHVRVLKKFGSGSTATEPAEKGPTP